MRENEGYRETLMILRERFGGKDSITAREFSEYIGLDYQITQRYIKENKLPGRKVGRRYIILITQIARWETQRQ